METIIRVMLSVFLVGLIVMTIVFFSIFGILPAEKLTQVLQGGDSTSSQPTIIISTTTVVERIIQGGGGNGSDGDQNQQPTQNNNGGDTQEDEPLQPDPGGGDDQNQQETGPTEQDLPPAVFNTSGVITNIGSNFLQVDSDASHMEIVPSSGIVPVTIDITDSTNLLNQDNENISLSDFSIGQEISIESPSNIKNQTEFEASNIRIME